jgi:uncharacterized protein YggU (UPF0235/DUF167 family)
MSHYYWTENKTLILNLRIIPGAQKSNFAGISDDIALINFLSKAFGISKSQISIVSGLKSRIKRVLLMNPKTLPIEAQIEIVAPHLKIH